MASISANFSATGNGTPLAVKRGETLDYVVNGTFSGTWVLEKSEDNVNYSQVATGTSTSSGSITVDGNSQHVQYRFRCSAYTSGTIETGLLDGEDLALEPLANLGSVPSAVQGTCEVKHYGSGPYVKSVFTLLSMPVTVTSVTTGNGVGGTQFFDFPEGYIRHLGTTASLSIAVTDTDDYTDGTPEGDVGIGTVAPANADALGTDATDDDFGTATAFTLSSHAGSVSIPPEAAANFDGTSTAVNLFLNALVDAADIDDDATDDMLFSGTITVHWLNLGDY